MFTRDELVGGRYWTFEWNAFARGTERNKNWPFSLRRGVPREDLLQLDDAGPAQLAHLRRDEGPRKPQIQDRDGRRSPAPSNSGASKSD